MSRVEVRFVSDQHLRPEELERSRQFIQSLKGCIGEVGHLYLLGDLFDFCLGAEHIRRAGEAYQQVCDGLREIVQNGLPVSFVAGNRDFLALPVVRSLGVEAVEDSIDLELGGRKVHLCHGDTLCTQDRRYQMFRRFIRSSVVRNTIQAIPFTLSHRLARWMRKTSEVEVKVKSALSMEPTEEALEHLSSQGVDVVICGHVHRAGIRTVKGEGERSLALYTLGAWEGDGNTGEFLDFQDGEFVFSGGGQGG